MKFQSLHQFFLRAGVLSLIAFRLLFSTDLQGSDSETTAPQDKPAKVKVKGYGFWGNLELKRTLRLIREDKESPVISANDIEDGALMVLSAVQTDGYLHPELTVELEFANGEVEEYAADLDGFLTLPESLKATKVTYRVEPGLFYRYGEITFSGLSAIEEKKARYYFVAQQFIIPQAKLRVFTPSRLKKSADNLREALVRLGYRNAKVTTGEPRYDHNTGTVNVHITVDEGEKHIVERSRIETFYRGEDRPEETGIVFPFEPYSRFWEQDFAQRFRNQQYREGYPDTTVEIEIPEYKPKMDIITRIHSGDQIRVGEINFRPYRIEEDKETGEKTELPGRTRARAIQHRIPLETGELLNVLDVQQGHLRLSHMGVFDRVDVSYEESETDPYVRDITYTLREQKPLELSVFAAYGSYELLMGGFELAHRNVFGLAHRWRLFGKQSFKSTRAESSYSIPYLFGSEFSFDATGVYLHREEISFIREERGGSFGVKRSFDWLQGDMGLRFGYENLNTRNEDFNPNFGIERANASTVSYSIQRDRRDNPLYPHSGYQLTGNVEVATDSLGGEVNYQRFDIGANIHYTFPTQQIFHASLSHGFVAPEGTSSEDLPFNKRFFPGGENTVRGYLQGEATPRDDMGNNIGAESFMLLNVELEQPVASGWTAVFFTDVVGVAAEMDNYPFDEILTSVGAGVRWNSVIGPVRLEYGYNLNRRQGDPSGTLHFSVGFPF